MEPTYRDNSPRQLLLITPFPLALMLAASALALMGCGGDATTSMPDVDSDGGVPMSEGRADDSLCGCLAGECVEITDEAGETGNFCDCGRRFAGELCGECAPGYTGEDCALCDTGYIESAANGELCVPNVCADDACSGHGACSAAPTSGGSEEAVCACDPRFSGAACEECAPGYQGVDCETCAAGYTFDGAACVEAACLATPCGRRGECVDPDGDGTGVCACDDGWEGTSCDMCREGYVLVGGECIPDACSGVECGEGTCVEEEGAAYCDCAAGYEGVVCDECAEGYTAVTAGRITSCENVLPVTGRRLNTWLDAADISSITTDSLGRVTNWVGNPGRLWSLGGRLDARPRYIVLPERAVEFDGNDDISAAVPLIDEGEQYAMFVVASWNPTGGRQTLFDAVHTDESEAYSLEALDANRVRFRHRGISDGAADVVVSDDFGRGRQLIVVQRAPFLTGSVLKVGNGTDATTAVTTTSGFVTTPFVMSGRCFSYGGDGDCNLDGRLYEVIVYEGTLSTDEHDAIVAYLREKWSL